jgi:hypothetical protein
MTASAGNDPGGGLADATAETIARAAVVAGLLVDGLSRPEIVAEARERWGLAPRSTDRLIAHARGQLREAWELEREQLLAVLLTRCDRIYREAMACANHGAALGAINAAARLAQL